jgi:hypothetical protein
LVDYFRTGLIEAGIEVEMIGIRILIEPVQNQRLRVKICLTVIIF